MRPPVTIHNAALRPTGLVVTTTPKVEWRAAVRDLGRRASRAPLAYVRAGYVLLLACVLLTLARSGARSELVGVDQAVAALIVASAFLLLPADASVEV
ncbi:MAG: hypothetical protein WKH64_13555 [Chloroflexia bacterium]